MRFVYLLLPTVLVNADAPVVEISHGSLRGKYVNTPKGRIFNAYLGIPYAEPPVGALRFEAPQAAKPWNGILNVSDDSKVCHPYSSKIARHIGDEDCLYLNVYSPQLLTPDKKLLPVMIFIHGGGFMQGNANFKTFDPRKLMDKDIVLVIPNYRLGPLGFLSTGDDVVPGNNGLKDQNFAIKWAKENIASFGGDPNRITLFGHSAGGVSVHHHMFSPLSKDLIKGVISQSGSALCSFGLDPNDEVQRNTKTLAESFNCSTESSQEMVNCLRLQDPYVLVQRLDLFHVWNNAPQSPFKPVIESNIEGAFLPQHPIDVIKSGNAAQIPLIIGMATEDGTQKSAFIFNNSQRVNEFNDDFLRIAPLTVGYYGCPNKDQISKDIRKYYFRDERIGNTSKPAVTDMHTDGIYLHPMDEIVRLHVNYTNQPVYYYAFGYRGSVSYSSVFGDSTYDYGVCHIDQLLYLFTGEIDFPDYIPTDKDKHMTEILTTLWTNFAETGNPTPTIDSLITTKWEPIKSENLEYYLFKNDTTAEMAEKLYWKRAEFWRTLPLGF